MRRPYIYLAGDLSGWPKGTVPTPPILRNFDQYSSELVNGEDGGAWAPTDPIVVGQAMAAGADMTLGGTSLIEGDVETVKGNTLGNEDYAPGLVLLDDARPTFQTARTRTVVVPLGFFHELNTEWSPMAGDPTHMLDPTTLGAMTVATSTVGSVPASILTVALPFRAQHRGATIFQVDFRFVIAGPRTALPTSLPKFRVARCSGPTIAALHTSSVSPYDANGWYVDQAATVADFYLNGKTRIITYLPDQFNTAIDPGTYAYIAQVQVEQPMGDGIGDLWLSATVALTNIADMGEEF